MHPSALKAALLDSSGPKHAGSDKFRILSLDSIETQPHVYIDMVVLLQGVDIGSLGAMKAEQWRFEVT